MQFTIEGKPQSKLRARTFYNTRMGKMQSVTPEKTKDYESLVRWSYAAAGGEYMGEKVLECTINAFYPMPKAFSKAKRKAAILGQIRPQTKPDLDNCIKIIFDALNGVCFYDDKQVVEIHAYKWYGERPRVEVTINEVRNEEEQKKGQRNMQGLQKRR